MTARQCRTRNREVRNILKASGRLAAIRYARSRYGLCFIPARTLVEDIRDGRPWMKYPVGIAVGPTDHNHSLLQ